MPDSGLGHGPQTTAVRLQPLPPTPRMALAVSRRLGQTALASLLMKGEGPQLHPCYCQVSGHVLPLINASSCSSRAFLALPTPLGRLLQSLERQETTSFPAWMCLPGLRHPLIWCRRCLSPSAAARFLTRHKPLPGRDSVSPARPARGPCCHPHPHPRLPGETTEQTAFQAALTLIRDDPEKAENTRLFSAQDVPRTAWGRGCQSRSASGRIKTHLTLSGSVQHARSQAVKLLMPPRSPRASLFSPVSSLSHFAHRTGLIANCSPSIAARTGSSAPPGHPLHPPRL